MMNSSGYELLKGHDIDLNSVIDNFVLKVAAGEPLSLKTFKTVWKEKNATFLVVSTPSLQSVPEYMQTLFMTALDRLDNPTPLHCVSKLHRVQNDMGKKFVFEPQRPGAPPPGGENHFRIENEDDLLLYLIANDGDLELDVPSAVRDVLESEDNIESIEGGGAIDSPGSVDQENLERECVSHANSDWILPSPFGPPPGNGPAYSLGNVVGNVEGSEMAGLGLVTEGQPSSLPVAEAETIPTSAGVNVPANVLPDGQPCESAGLGLVSEGQPGWLAQPQSDQLHLTVEMSTGQSLPSCLHMESGGQELSSAPPTPAQLPANEPENGLTGLELGSEGQPRSISQAQCGQVPASAPEHTPDNGGGVHSENSGQMNGSVGLPAGNDSQTDELGTMSGGLGSVGGPPLSSLFAPSSGNVLDTAGTSEALNLPQTMEMEMEINGCGPSQIGNQSDHQLESQSAPGTGQQDFGGQPHNVPAVSVSMGLGCDSWVNSEGQKDHLSLGDFPTDPRLVALTVRPPECGWMTKCMSVLTDLADTIQNLPPDIAEDINPDLLMSGPSRSHPQSSQPWQGRIGFHSEIQCDPSQSRSVDHTEGLLGNQVTLSGDPVTDLRTSVPFEAKVGAIYAVYCLYRLQCLQPTVCVHLPVPLLSRILDLVPELHSRGVLDAVHMIKTLYEEGAFVFDILRRPPHTLEMKISATDTEMNASRELIFHIKQTLRSAGNSGVLKRMCKEYESVRSKVCGGSPFGRLLGMDQLFDSTLGEQIGVLVEDKYVDIVAAVTDQARLKKEIRDRMRREELDRKEREEKRRIEAEKAEKKKAARERAAQRRKEKRSQERAAKNQGKKSRQSQSKSQGGSTIDCMDFGGDIDLGGLPPAARRAVKRDLERKREAREAQQQLSEAV